MRFCFITGHRPNRFKFPENDPRCDKIKSAIRSEIIRLYEQDGIRGVWVGGAAGVDTWLRRSCWNCNSRSSTMTWNSMLPSFTEFGDTLLRNKKNAINAS